jgi:methanethiol S-methyltransferase
VARENAADRPAKWKQIMKRPLFFAYGVICYLMFLGVYAYFCAFTANVLAPRTIDAPVVGPWQSAVAINLALLATFGIQHSAMARPAFKRRWTRIVPQPIERSTYVFASVIVTALLVWQWRPIDAVVWDVQNAVGRGVLWTLFAIGWLMVPVVSLMINHFDLFGVRQVWLYFRGREYQSLPFRTPWLYSHVRHPLYVAWALAFWATPTMTAGHLLFAIGLTAYMVAAALVEERDLLAHFGKQYAAYQRAVPRYIPKFGKRTTTLQESQRTPSGQSL